jgi:hypothetical protein
MAAIRRRGFTPTTPAARPRNDVYTGLLILGLVAMIAASGLLLAEIWGEYDWQIKPPKQSAAPGQQTLMFRDAPSPS